MFFSSGPKAADDSKLKAEVSGQKAKGFDDKLKASGCLVYVANSTEDQHDGLKARDSETSLEEASETHYSPVVHTRNGSAGFGAGSDSELGAQRSQRCPNLTDTPDLPENWLVETFH